MKPAGREDTILWIAAIIAILLVLALTYATMMLWNGANPVSEIKKPAVFPDTSGPVTLVTTRYPQETSTTGRGVQGSAFLPGSSPAQEVNAGICPSPPLVFNDSQPVTVLKPGNFLFSTPSAKGAIPLGGIVYHEQGYTRVFDANGTQVFIVNDSVSVTNSPAGPISTSYTAGLQGDAVPIRENDFLAIIYSPGLKICEGSIITPPGVKPPVSQFEVH